MEAFQLTEGFVVGEFPADLHANDRELLLMWLFGTSSSDPGSDIRGSDLYFVFSLGGALFLIELTMSAYMDMM